MTQFDREAILQKLSRLVDRLDRLKRFENITLAPYLEDEDYQDIIERRLELYRPTSILCKADLCLKFGEAE
jgi:hypothetical protein